MAKEGGAEGPESAVKHYDTHFEVGHAAVIRPNIKPRLDSEKFLHISLLLANRMQSRR